MGKEWDRINRRTGTYYVDSEGRRRARARQKFERDQYGFQMGTIFLGVMIMMFAPAFPEKMFLGIGIGLVVFLLGLSSLLLARKRKRAR